MGFLLRMCLVFDSFLMKSTKAEISENMAQRGNGITAQRLRREWGILAGITIESGEIIRHNVSLW